MTTARDESGFTLIELVVALALLAILMSAGMYSINQGLLLSRDVQDRHEAATLATSVMEQAESMAQTTSGFTKVALTVTTPTVVKQPESGVTYTSTETSEWESQGQSGSICASGKNEALILRTTVVTSWGGAGESVSQSTLLAPPNGSFSSSDGSLPVLVEQSDGTGESGVTVTVSPSGSTSGSPVAITTGTDGCAFFAQLPAGSYNVKVSSANGVGINEQQTYEVDNLTINAGELGQTINAFYEPAGSIDWTYQPTGPPPAGGMGISIDNPSQGLTDNMFSFSGTSPGLTPVYPSTYSVFAGSCTDADPNGTSTGTNPLPFYSPGTYPNIASSVTVSPSQPPPKASVPLYPLDIQVQPSGGVASSQAASPSGTLPTATAGEGGVCPYGPNPVYKLSPVQAGVSQTAVGLGEMTINVTVDVTSGGITTTETGSTKVWVKPDGVHQVTSGSVASSPIPGPVVIPVS